METLNKSAKKDIERALLIGDFKYYIKHNTKLLLVGAMVTSAFLYKFPEVSQFIIQTFGVNLNNVKLDVIKP